jgi:superfamily I DNA/RNA helicase
VFADQATGTGHTMIDAVAGSGKTTTLLEALTHIPAGLSVAFLAFNKDIAKELSIRAPAGVDVSTLHSLGLKAVRKAFKNPRVDADKTKIIAERIAGSKIAPVLRREWCYSVVKCVGLAKSCLAETPEAIEDVIDAHQLCPPEHAEERPLFVADVLAVLAACKARVDPVTKTLSLGQIDFDDMVWLPHAHALRIPQYDRVFVDETQDLNAAQIALILKAVKPGGRICAVGDPRQAIYGFRGASADAFGNVQRALRAKVLPLSVTYRCALAVVREAKAYVTHLEAAPNAAEGRCEGADAARMRTEAREGDFVLSRTNAPMLRICLGFLAEGRRATIQGRDIGTKLTSVIKRANTDNVDAMLAHVGAWATLEIERLEARQRDASSIEDTRECIYVLSEGETSVATVVSKIERLFSDGNDNNRITLSTTHKAKGLERDRVWLLKDTYMRAKILKRGEKPKPPSIEEVNLYYVACTRARKELYLVTGKL